MKPVDPRLLRYARAARRFFAVGAVLALVQTACTVGFAWFLSQTVVRAIDGAGLAELDWSVAALALAVVARSAVGWLLERTSARGAAIVKSQLRGRMLTALARLGPAWAARRNSARLATVAGQGLDALDGYFSRYLPQLILTAIATPVIVLVLFDQDWLSGLSVLVTLPIIPVFMVLVGWATQKAQRAQWLTLARLSSGFLDVVAGLATLTLFGRQHRQTARIEAVTEEYRARTMSVLRLSFVSGFVLEVAASLAVALVAVSIGLRLIDGSLGLSVGLFVLLLAPEAFLPLRSVGTQFHAAADGVAAADEVFEILDAAAALPEPAPASATASSGTVPRTADELRLVDVGVRYGERWAVQGVSARFRRGTITAVTGASGAGKSSIVGALLGFVPYEGRIELGAVPVEEPGERGWLAWAGQRAGLSAGTVFDNVSLGSARPSRALAERALALAAGTGIPLDLVLGVEGAGLSGGQAQRVSVARAFYRALERDCPVIVLDEPSSALDFDTERRLLAGLRTLADEGRIVIVVTHRLGLVRAADERLGIGAPVVVPVAGVAVAGVAAEPAIALAAQR